MIGKIFQNNKTACVIFAAVLVICALLAVLKPPTPHVLSHIPQEFKDNADDRYSETVLDIIILNIVRGRNTTTAASDTYIGIAGQVYQVNEGFPATLGNILLWMPRLLNGARITISLTVASVTAGLFFSIFVALGRISRFKLLSKISGMYIFFFRGTPLLMQLYFIYFALPEINPAFMIKDRFMAGFIAFTLNITAYSAEFIRAGIQSIDKGQYEASHALGFRYGQSMRLIIIPQSIRRLIPSVSNEFIMVLKDASLVSIISLQDLTYETRAISSATASAIVYLPAMALYLIMTAFFTFVFEKAEKRFSVYH